MRLSLEDILQRCVRALCKQENKGENDTNVAQQSEVGCQDRNFRKPGKRSFYFEV